MQLEKWKRGVEEKDLVIRDLEYKVAVAKKTKDEYIVRAACPSPRPAHGRRFPCLPAFLRLRSPS